MECVFCKGVIMKWEAGDDPDREHRLHFPSCNFYMKQETEDGIIMAIPFNTLLNPFAYREILFCKPRRLLQKNTPPQILNARNCSEDAK